MQGAESSWQGCFQFGCVLVYAVVFLFEPDLMDDGVLQIKREGYNSHLGLRVWLEYVVW
jgi:hypothetical protein